MKMDAAFFNENDLENHPGSMGMRVVEIGEDHAVLEMRLEQHHMNLNGFAHGGGIASLADTTCGYPTKANLPEDAKGFTTSEFKIHFLRPAQIGDTLRCRSKRIHQGKTNWIWDATVYNADTDKNIAEFRCTNIIFY